MPDAPVALDVNDLRTYRAHWQRVGPVLEKLRRRELRAMTEEQHLQALLDVLDLVSPDAPPKPVCGLADFYRRWRRS